MSELLFAFYITEIYGVDPAVMGILIFIFLLWDAVTDPVLGYLFARRNISKRGLIQMQLIGAVLSSFSFCAVFFKPEMSDAGLVIYATCVGLVFRTTYTIYDVPQNTLLKRLSYSDKSRVTLSALRVAGSALATITIGLATTSILTAADYSDEQEKFVTVAILFALIAVFSSFSLSIVGRNFPDEEERPKPIDTSMIIETLKKPDLLTLYISVFVLSLGWPVFGKLIPFFGNYVLEIDTASGLLFMSMAIASFVSQPLWLFLGRTISRKMTITVVATLTYIFCGLFILLSSRNLMLAVASVAALSAVSSAMNMLMWTRLADRLSDIVNQGVNDLLAFGTFTFSAKIGAGVGGLILGASLSASGYETGEALSEAGKLIIICSMAIIPAIATFIAAKLMTWETTRV